MSSPAEIDRLGDPEPTERESQGAGLGFVHSQPPTHVIGSHARHAAIRLVPFAVHVSPPKDMDARCRDEDLDRCRAACEPLRPRRPFSQDLRLK